MDEGNLSWSGDARWLMETLIFSFLSCSGSGDVKSSVDIIDPLNVRSLCKYGNCSEAFIRFDMCAVTA